MSVFVGWWATGQAWYDRASEAGHWFRALFFLVMGFVLILDALLELTTEVMTRVSTGAWHMQSLADWFSQSTAPPSWFHSIPLAPFLLVFGLLTFRGGLAVLSGQDDDDDEEKQEQP